MRLKIFVTLLLVFGCVSVYYSDNGLLPYPDVEFADAATYPVLKVIDVATVEIHYEDTPTVVKLIGVKVPEAMHPDNSNETAQIEATAFLHNLLLGESVYLHFEGDAPETAEDFQAYLYRAPDRLFVNLEVVRQGYAQTNTLVPFAHLSRFSHYEGRAQVVKKGLWQAKESIREDVIASQALPTADTAVYITRTGSKYHRAGCVYLRRSRISVSREDAERYYLPCLLCNP